MSIGLTSSYVASQKQESNPIKENSRPARNVSCTSIAVVSLVALAIIGVLAAGITLTTLGALTANPIFLNIGICLIVGSVLGVAEAILFSCK